MEPEVGANPSGRGCSPRAPAAPIVAISAPARSTPRQNSRLRSAALAVLCRLIPLISHLPRRVASPPRACRDLLSLHEKGVGGQHRPITHRHVVVDEGADADRTASANRGSTGLVSAVLLRVALDDA